MATTQKLFVLGTHAGVGKTVVSAVVAQALGATYWKPIHCGSSLDTDFIRTHTQSRVFESVFSTTENGNAAEWIEKENKKLKVPFKVPNVNPLVIEGMSGIFTPLDATGTTLLDAIHPMEVDVLLVCESNTETLNQVVMNCQNLQWLGFNVLGIIYNGKEQQAQEKIITAMTGVQHKWHLPRIENDAKSIQKAADSFQKELKAWMK